MVHDEPQADMMGIHTNHTNQPWIWTVILDLIVKLLFRWTDLYADDTNLSWVGRHLLKTNNYIPKNPRNDQ